MSDEFSLPEAGAVEQTIEIGRNSYRVFAYRSPGRGGARVRWNLYALEDDGAHQRGLTFGIAASVQEAMEQVHLAARVHAATGTTRPLRAARTFRPGPMD